MKIIKQTITAIINNQKTNGYDFAVVAICLNCREYSGWMKSYRMLVHGPHRLLKITSLLFHHSLYLHMVYYYDLFFAFVT